MILGVGIGEPQQPKSGNPVSSNKMTRTLGAPKEVLGGAGQERVGSRIFVPAVRQSAYACQDRLPHRLRLCLDGAEHGAQAGPQIVHLVE
jgi:hypothetical protein